ncbi:transposase [Spirosoma fluminis]
METNHPATPTPRGPCSNAVLKIARSGAPWRDLPERFGRWNSVYQRFRRWAKSGVWQNDF